MYISERSVGFRKPLFSKHILYSAILNYMNRYDLGFNIINIAALITQTIGRFCFYESNYLCNIGFKLRVSNKAQISSNINCVLIISIKEE